MQSTMVSRLGVVIFIVGLVLIVVSSVGIATKPAWASSVIVETLPPTGVTRTSAVLRGRVNGWVSEAWFYWWDVDGVTYPSYQRMSTPQQSGVSGEYSYEITGLQPGARYQFQARVDGPPGWGGVLRFTTLALVLNPPQASFSFSPANPMPGELVIFRDESVTGTNAIADYLWDFDGNGVWDARGEYEQTVSYTYGSPSTYHVIHKVVDTIGLSDTSAKNVVVAETPPPTAPTAEFAYSPILPNIGERVVFDAGDSEPGSGYIVSYSWNFGDGYENVGEVVTHSYATEDNYTVKLTVTNSGGLSGTATTTVWVTREEIPMEPIGGVQIPTSLNTAMLAIGLVLTPLGLAMAVRGKVR